MAPADSAADASAPFVWHCNVSAVRPREEELQAATSGCPVLALQETGFRREEEAVEAFRRLWPDYHLVGHFVHDGEGVGCALLVHHHLRWRAPSRRSVRRHRSLSVDVLLRDRWLRVTSLYAPPVASGFDLDGGLLSAGLDAPFSLVVGDLNARSVLLGCRSTNRHGEDLADFLERAQSVVSLREVTRPSFLHRSCGFQDTIDWALATTAAARLLRAELRPSVGSDHLPLLVLSSRPVLHARRDSAVPRWRTSAVRDWAPFERAVSTELQEAALVPAPVPSSPAEVDSVAAAFEGAIQRAADSCLERSRPRSDSSLLPAPWWIVLLVRERNRLRRQLARHSPPPPDLRRRHARARTELQRELLAFRRRRFEEQSRLFAQGPRRGPEFWSGVRRWFRGPTSHLPPLESDASEPAVSPLDRAEAFARHLQRALSGLQDPSFEEDFRAEVEEAVSSNSALQPLPRLPEDAHTDQDDVTRPVTTGEVVLELRRLHAGRAPGPDGIATDLLRHCPLVAAAALASLFSSSLTLGYVPQRWRLGLVRLLPKPGRPLTRPSDFRPIALTSTVGKVLERVVARRFASLCETRGLLQPEQSAFRLARGTEEQLVHVGQRVSQALNGGLTTTLVALDLDKAYDCVWHAGLLHRLLGCFSTATCRWVAGFLRQREARVLEDGVVSTAFRTTAGVPQGSPLSPALFTFFVGELPLPREPLTGATLYADDLALWACGSSPADALDRVQPHLDRAVLWGQRWRLRFNPAKTQVGWFSRRTRWPASATPEPRLLGHQLAWSDHVDLLGFRLDRRLLLLPQANRVAARLWPRIMELRRWAWAFRRTPARIGTFVYKVLLRPAISYGAPLWVLACTTARERLRRTERHGLRAARRTGLATSLQQLYVGLAEIDVFLRAAAVRFLLRAAESRNGRLLAAFSTLARQRTDRARFDPPLERLFALCDEEERERVRTALTELQVQPGPFDSTRQGRNRREDSDLWGVSPFYS